jgi:hypothetical protein
MGHRPDEGMRTRRKHEKRSDSTDSLWLTSTGRAVAETRGKQPQYREYQVGDKFFRRRNPVRTIKSASDKETYKISLKLHKYEGPYRVKRRVNAGVFVTEIGGEEVRIHVINMKPAVG